jgi:hypothetical protein
MGEVRLAELSEPAHRRVAEKIIKLGMGTKLGLGGSSNPGGHPMDVTHRFPLVQFPQ